MKLFFLRHGESEANIQKTFCNKGCKLGLTDKGRAQVQNFLDETKELKFALGFASPLLRAFQTSQIISNKININFEINDALLEIDVGILEGKCEKDCREEFHDIIKEWLIEKKWDNRIKQGESYNDLKSRFVPFIESLKQKYFNTDSNILIIGHNGLFRCMIPFICSNLSYDFAYQNTLSFCEYIIIEVTGNDFSCIKWGNKFMNQHP